MRRLNRWAAALAILLAATACGGGDLTAKYLVSVREPASKPITPDEALRGELAVSSAGCVVLRRAEGEALLWAPAGSGLEDAGTAVRITGFGTFELGDEVDLKGKFETVGLPTPKQNRPLNYAECIPEKERKAASVALVAETP